MVKTPNGVGNLEEAMNWMLNWLTSETNNANEYTAHDAERSRQ